MVRMLMTVILAVGLGLAQEIQTGREADRVMGFSHEKTTHHFELNQDGGVIEARADDLKDTASRDEIRNHFKHIREMFAAGNFHAPMLVHDREDVPGTATMSLLKQDIHWELQDIPRGARMTIIVDSKEARDAIHEFLRFQIADHHTGDCTAVR